jgi:hypothetical protein
MYGALTYPIVEDRQLFVAALAPFLVLYDAESESDLSMDLDDARARIRELETELKETADIGCQWRRAHDRQVELRNALANADQRWVPVVDRLPPELFPSPMYVITGEEGTEFGFWNGRWWAGTDGTVRGVTHWLALGPVP